VGNISLDDNGNPVIGGFGDATNALMQQLATQAAAANIKIKVSFGGGGGSYDNLWNIITAANVQSIATALVQFCQSLGLSGVDFDIETFADSTDRTALQTLCGNLIQLFKQGDASLETSLCVNAGFGPNFPWQAIAANILNGTLSNGVTALDRVYIMSYYNDIVSEQGWVSGWVGWLSDTYSIPSQRVSVGLDNTDADAYNIGDFAAWAATQQLGTAYWYVNPQTADTLASSQASLNTIATSYAAAAAALV